MLRQLAIQYLIVQTWYQSNTKIYILSLGIIFIGRYINVILRHMQKKQYYWETKRNGLSHHNF